MAAIFPSVFRANVLVTGADGLSVSAGGIGAGLTATEIGALGVGDIVADNKVAVNSTVADGTNVLHVAGTFGATGPALLGDTVDITGAVDLTSTLQVDGVATFGADVVANVALDVMGPTNLVGAVDLTSTLQVDDDAIFGADVTINGDLILTGGLSLPQITGEATPLANDEVKVALASSVIPDFGMLLIMVSSNGTGGPTATFSASKPNAAAVGVVSTLHSSGSFINALSADTMYLDLEWTAGAVTPNLFYTASSVTDDVAHEYNVTTLVAAGPDVTP